MVEAVIPTLRGLVLLLLALTLRSVALAHQLDEYLQATLVAIEPGEIRLEINLTPGVAVAEQVISLLDRNHDGVLSTNEVAGYGELLKRDLAIRLDHRDLELNLAAFYCPGPVEIRTGLGIMQMEFTAHIAPVAKGHHTLAFNNRHLTKISIYVLNAALPKSGEIQISRQNRNDNQSAGEIEFVFHESASFSGIFPLVTVLSVALLSGSFLLARPNEKFAESTAAAAGFQRNWIRFGNSGQSCEPPRDLPAVAPKKLIAPDFEQSQTSFAPASK
jgi:hypothetical protein